MDSMQIKQLIESKLETVNVIPDGEGCNFSVTVIGELFTGMTPVKKQQLVYSCVNEYIADGSIHALTIKAYTPDQWQKINE